MAEAPLWVNDAGLQWVRTEVCKGADLVDGKAWISNFQQKLTDANSCLAAGGLRRGRVLRQTLSDGDAPQYYSGGGDANLPMRNEVLRAMQDQNRRDGKDPSRGCGRKVRLINNQEVIFWFNVGPPGSGYRDRVYVTDAYCPHQQACLNESELKDIEDVTGEKQCMVRCHRHNKAFDLRTGYSPGNAERLQTYPCRYEHGHWYVAIGPAPLQGAQIPVQGGYPSHIAVDPASSSQSQAVCTQESEDAESMDVDPAPKRPRLEESSMPMPTPCRTLQPHMTVA